MIVGLQKRQAETWVLCQTFWKELDTNLFGIYLVYPARKDVKAVCKLMESGEIILKDVKYRSPLMYFIKLIMCEEMRNSISLW